MRADFCWSWRQRADAKRHESQGFSIGCKQRWRRSLARRNWGRCCGRWMRWRDCVRGLLSPEGSLRDDLYKDAIGQGGAAEDVNDAVAGEAAEHALGLWAGIGV